MNTNALRAGVVALLALVLCGCNFEVATTTGGRVVSDPSGIDCRIDEGQCLIEELQEAEIPSRSLLRKTQGFSVSLPKYKLEELIERGSCATIHDHTIVLIDEKLYDPNLGLVTEGESGIPEKYTI